MKRVLCSVLVAALPFGSVLADRRSRRTLRRPSSTSTSCRTFPARASRACPSNMAQAATRLVTRMSNPPLSMRPFLRGRTRSVDRTGMAAKKVTAVRLGLGRQSTVRDYPSCRAPPAASFFVLDLASGGAFALARSRASRRRSRRSRRLFARSAGCRSGGTGVGASAAPVTSSTKRAWIGSDAAGRASMN
jgi:hypothetical protein